MKNFIKIIIILFICIVYANTFASIESQLAAVGYQIAVHPERFFIDIQNDVEDLSAGGDVKRFQLSTNLMWDLLTAFNVNDVPNAR